MNNTYVSAAKAIAYGNGQQESTHGETSKDHISKENGGGPALCRGLHRYISPETVELKHHHGIPLVTSGRISGEEIK